MNGYSIPKATLGRLPQYLQHLKSQPSKKGATISATAIAKELSLGEVQVRKDLAAVCGAGKPKIGYVKDTLIDSLERHLGYRGYTNAVLVGAGKLGKALLDYDGFEEFGVRIIAGFDCNERAFQSDKSGKAVLPIDKIESFCAENEVSLGVITVGQGSAQEICDKLILSGVKAIWNFAQCDLKVPSGIILKQENLALSLAYLNNKICK